MDNSSLHPEGIYDPSKRFAFTNITDEDFKSFWGGQPMVVKAHDTVELPHHLAVKLTRELVDKILIGEIKIDTEKMRQESRNFYVTSPKGMSLGIPEVRKPLEDKICRELASDEESPSVIAMRAQIKEELIRNANGENNPEPPVTANSIEEFAQIPHGGIQESNKEKSPIKLKKVEATQSQPEPKPSKPANS